MEWSGLGLGGAAVVGYNAEGIYFLNHAASGFDTVADIISCGTIQKRKKRQDDPVSRVEMLEFPMDPQLRMQAEECIDWHFRDVIIHDINAMELASLLSDYPCPMTRQQAIYDAGRYVQYTQSPLCYVSSLPQVNYEISLAFPVYAAQLCCYENG